MKNELKEIEKSMEKIKKNHIGGIHLLFLSMLNIAHSVLFNKKKIVQSHTK